jgi:hypothetical protein
LAAGRPPDFLVRFLRPPSLAPVRANFLPKRNRGIAQMKQHQYHRGISEAAAALGDETKLRGSISDVDRVVRILDGNISTEEERARADSDQVEPYPAALK